MRWLSAAASVEIERPVEEVWGYLTTVERMDEWMTGVSEPRRTSDGPLREGATFASKYGYREETADVDYSVTRFEPPHRYAIEAVEGRFPYRATFTLEPIAEGTRVTKEAAAGSHSLRASLTFMLLRPLVRSVMRRGVRAELERLRDAIEGEGVRGGKRMP